MMKQGSDLRHSLTLHIYISQKTQQFDTSLFPIHINYMERHFILGLIILSVPLTMVLA